MLMRSLLSQGRNCWRISRAKNFAWLIDGEAYFGALRESLEAARHEILIVGWDIDSRVQLVRDRRSSYYPSPLAETLESLIGRRPELRVHVLSWDFAMLYVLERELLPAFRFGWLSSDRLQFHLDSCHAIGASHHQKFVVIDGAVAFVGGLDLTKNRWDTPEHAHEDPRRVNPAGDAYRPFHDIQAVVSGEIAGQLRELGKSRWRNATGDILPAIGDIRESRSEACWPESVNAQASDIRSGLARTWAPSDGDSVCREVEHLFVDMIETANRYIYIENQYFTSDAITDALCHQLQDPQGPEIVIVLPDETSGWLEQLTMETLRNRCISRLKSADTHEHLAIAAPVSEQLKEQSINVHSKLMIVDGHWIRIGSANISGRSMGLDSECDLIVESDDRSIANRMCSELLAEHLGADLRHVAETLVERGILAVLAEFGGSERQLKTIDVDFDSQEESLEPIARIADREAPIERSWSRQPDPDKAQTDESDGRAGFSLRRAGRASLTLIAFGVVACAVWFAWHGPSSIDLETLVAKLGASADHWFAPILAVLAFVAGSLVVVPVTVMIAICGLLFAPITASLCAMSGVLASAAVNYAIARRYGDPVLARVPNAVTKRVRTIANASDALSVAGLRLVPIAPFTVFNLVAGACGVRLRDFMLGTFAGMAPGTFLICLTVDRARAVLRNEPILDPWIIGIMAACGAMLISMRVLAKRRAN